MRNTPICTRASQQPNCTSSCLLLSGGVRSLMDTAIPETEIPPVQLYIITVSDGVVDGGRGTSGRVGGVDMYRSRNLLHCIAELACSRGGQTWVGFIGRLCEGTLRGFVRKHTDNAGISQDNTTSGVRRPGHLLAAASRNIHNRCTSKQVPSLLCTPPPLFATTGATMR